MDAGKHDLFCAAIQSGLNIEDHIGNGAASTFAAGNGCDAKRALIVASILYFDEGTRAAMQTGERLAGDRFEVKRLLRKIKNIRNKMIFSIIGYNAR